MRDVARYANGLGVSKCFETPVRATASFTLVVAAMTLPRAGHAAASLQDGRGFLVGGYMDAPSVQPESAELYGPATGAFAPAGRLEPFQQTATATTQPSGEVLVITCGDPRPHYFDPVTGALSKKHPTVTGELWTSRCCHTATLLQDGRFLIAGGWSAAPRGGVIVDAEVFEE